MGEKQNRPFHFSFNSSLKVGFQGSRITSDAGLLLVRELDERLGLDQLISDNLTDNRRGKNTQLPLPDLLRQSIYSRLAGYEDLNDAERLSNDPTFRLIGSEKIRDRGAALPSRLHWFETQVSDASCEPKRPGGHEPGNDCEGRRAGSVIAGGAGHGLDRDSGLRGAGAERLQHTLCVHLLSPAAVVQLLKATAWPRNCGRATFTAPTNGSNS